MSGFAKLKNAGESVSGKPQPLDLSDFSSGGSERRGNPREDQEIADRVARRHGLAEEPVGRVPLKRGSTVTDKIFISGPLATLNRFRELCNDRGGIPYHEALQLLLDRYDGADRS
tara:strand:+ start:5232 stop:5576 length:345 start_codon:yes stop_codon:yes gene_type:complete